MRDQECVAFLRWALPRIGRVGEASAYLGWVEDLVARFGGDPPKVFAGPLAEID